MPTIGPGYFYIDPAKTASRAISAVLAERYNGQQCTMDELPAAVAAGAFVFASVRNPYDRCLSLWWSLTTPGDRYGVAAAAGRSPIDCLQYLSGGAFARANGATHVHLTQSCSENVGDVKLDAVVRFESLLEDFNRLPFVTEPLAEIPIVNRKLSGRPLRWPLLDLGFLRAVESWLADDFERFGYEIGEIPNEVP